MTGPGEHWDGRYRAVEGAPDPALFLDEVAHLLPESGSMVDVAGGLGANALWFAKRGFAATVLDVSGEALDRASQAGDDHGLELECLDRDIEADGLPSGRSWDVALMHLFWDPDVLVALPGILSAGGLLLFAQPTVRNLERHERPGLRFLLEVGQLARLVKGMGELEVLELSEGWRDSGRHEARLIARSAP